jgi:GT2 family glycosyltransferase
MADIIDIAVLLTCYNRKEKTLACLRSLLERPLSVHANLTTYLLDDSSSDGTAYAVKKEFPQVRLLNGDGNYYWNGGMRAVFGAAKRDGHDFYLWLNDDVELCDGFLATLLTTYNTVTAKSSLLNIIVGAVKDPTSGEMTYSGFVRSSSWHPLKFSKLPPDPERPLECDTMNGNCVLIPDCIVQLIGNLDRIYIQQMGDLDYGIRARTAGAKIWISPGYVGTCQPNNHQIWGDPKRSLIERVKVINSPKGFPLKVWVHFARKHGGSAWPLFALSPYIKALLPITINTLKKIKFSRRGPYQKNGKERD